MSKYTIRFDVERDDKKVKQFFNNEFSRGNLIDFIVAFEIADKTRKQHYQGIMTVPSEKHLQQIRLNLKYNFLVNKSTYSIAKVTSESYKYYIVKGKEIVHSFGYDVDKLIKEYDEYCGVAKVKNSKNPRDKYLSYVKIHVDGPVKREELVKITLDYFCCSKMLFSLELLHKYVMYWYNSMREHDDGKEIKSFIKHYLDTYWDVKEYYAPVVLPDLL